MACAYCSVRHTGICTCQREAWRRATGAQRSQIRPQGKSNLVLRRRFWMCATLRGGTLGAVRTKRNAPGGAQNARCDVDGCPCSPRSWWTHSHLLPNGWFEAGRQAGNGSLACQKRREPQVSTIERELDIHCSVLTTQIRLLSYDIDEK